MIERDGLVLLCGLYWGLYFDDIQQYCARHIFEIIDL